MTHRANANVMHSVPAVCVQCMKADRDVSIEKTVQVVVLHES